jgi:hypothetical protein
MTRFLVETCAYILSIKHCSGNAAFTFKGMLMHRKTLTLKSTSRTSQPAPAAVEITPTCVIAGRSSKRAAKQSCTAVIERLGELIELRQTSFIQMRHGAGYCGIPVSLEDGWLTMTNVSIHGTKQSTVSQSILIQINDGSFIAHLHPVVTQSNPGSAK